MKPADDASDKVTEQETFKVARLVAWSVARLYHAESHVDDMVVEVFEALHTQAKRDPEILRDEARMKAFAWSAARRAAISRRHRDARTRKLKLATDLVERSGAVDPVERAARSELIQAIWEAVSKLPSDERNLILLKSSGMTVRVISETMGVSKSYVSRRLARAVELLGDLLRKDGIEL
jgi:RNA polymerase sigma factor (sigma-70 family)